MVIRRSEEVIELIKDVRWACTAGRRSYVIDIPAKARWIKDNPIITKYGVPYIFQNRQQVIGANKMLDMLLSNTLVKHYLLGSEEENKTEEELKPPKQESIKEETSQ
jgi:hypothetical protein